VAPTTHGVTRARRKEIRDGTDDQHTEIHFERPTNASRADCCFPSSRDATRELRRSREAAFRARERKLEIAPSFAYIAAMSDLKLSTLAIILGLIVALPSAWGLLNPRAFAEAVRKFPRYTPIGYVLVLLATAWFLYYVHLESVADFASMKKIFYLVFSAVGLCTCIFVKDFLPVRGLAVVLLLAAKLMVDTARWEDTGWRLLISTWAYVFVLAGMWFTISPWRLRDILNWSVATESRTRLISGVRVAFGLFVVVLGLTVFKAAEEKTSPAQANANMPHIALRS
jgi:hypothetical protein